MKNKTKRNLMLLCIAGLLCSSAACASETAKKPIETIAVGTTGQTTADGDTTVSETAATEAAGQASGDITIAETVLMEQDGIKVTATSLTEDRIWGTGIDVLVENTSAQNIGVSNNELIINGYMMTSIFSCSVASGKSAHDTIYFDKSVMEGAEITTVSDIVMDFHVFNSDSYETLFDTPEVQLPTSASGTVTQAKADDGTALYDQDGIRIVGKYVEEGTVLGSNVVLFIENTSAANVIVQCDNLSVNGLMMTALFSSQVNTGCMALDEITLLSSELESNNITSVDTVEVNFKIIDPASYATLHESGPVSFSTK